MQIIYIELSDHIRLRSRQPVFMGGWEEGVVTGERGGGENCVLPRVASILLRDCGAVDIPLVLLLTFDEPSYRCFRHGLC